jgi:hypothetical protein
VGLPDIGLAGWDRLRRLARMRRRVSYLRPEKAGEEWPGTWASVLSASPLILGTWPSGEFPLGMASALSPRLPRLPIDYLVMPTWAWEVPDVAGKILAAARDHVGRFPRHRLSFLCNAPAQERHFAEAGWPVVTLNIDMFRDETVFRPLADSQPLYDAVNNSRLSPAKRPELAAEIRSLCVISYYNSFEGLPAEFHRRHGQLKVLMPGAVFINRLTEAGCEFLSAAEVNRIYSQARVGLCLSAVEGQMFASIEYLLAGLPIVSTPSLGGRDYFFDPDYCAIVEPDPRQVRDAVAAMIGRAVPRERIRAKTMEKVARERGRFIAYVQDIIERRGGKMDFSAAFPRLLRDGWLTRWYDAPRDFAQIVDRTLLTMRLPFD